MFEILTASIALSLIFAFGWKWSVRHQNAGIVDVLWAFSLGGVVLWFALVSDGDVVRRLLFGLMTAAWGIRLGSHILGRLRAERSEDKRYHYLRNHWGVDADRKFFFFFQFQALANILLTFPIWIILAQRTSLVIYDVLAALLVVFAVLGEWLSDRQLKQWRSQPSNRGKTCRSGLWAFSRHPNYFFEWVHWLAYPVAGIQLLLNGHWFLWLCTWFAPVAMLVLLVRFTGIPYVEKQALRSRGDDYRRYQAEVSAFIPWFRKTKDK